MIGQEAAYLWLDDIYRYTRARSHSLILFAPLPANPRLCVLVRFFWSGVDVALM